MCAITSIASQPIKQFATFLFILEKKIVAYMKGDTREVSNFFLHYPKGLCWPLFFTIRETLRELEFK